GGASPGGRPASLLGRRCSIPFCAAVRRCGPWLVRRLTAPPDAELPARLVDESALSCLHAQGAGVVIWRTRSAVSTPGPSVGMSLALATLCRLFTPRARGGSTAP